MNNIYIKESDIPLTRTRKAFIKSLIMQRGVITYEDPGCKIVQCENKNAYRSISELHIIVKTRFKITSLTSLIKIIKAIITEEKCISLVWCTQIKKVVVKYMPNIDAAYITPYSMDRYYKEVGVDGYSLEDYKLIFDSL